MCNNLTFRYHLSHCILAVAALVTYCVVLISYYVAFRLSRPCGMPIKSLFVVTSLTLRFDSFDTI
jgi:hypothetical protein